MMSHTIVTGTKRDGRVERDLALKRVSLNTDPNWEAQALFAVIRLAKTKPKFTGVDVWESGLEKPSEPRRLGPIMITAAKLGYIRRTKQHQESTIPSQHARPMRVWRSLVHSKK